MITLNLCTGQSGVHQFARKCNIIDDTYTIFMYHIAFRCIHINCTHDCAEFLQ